MKEITLTVRITDEKTINKMQEIWRTGIDVTNFFINCINKLDLNEYKGH